MFRKFLDRVLRPASPMGEFTIVKTGNETVEAAMARARDTLDIFWRKFESGEADGYELKVGLTTPNEAVEHLWIEPTERQDGKIVGRLLIQPVDIEDLNLNDTITVDPDRISDWGYFKGGKLYGAFTQRAMLDTMSSGLRRQIEAALAPDALESGSV